MAAIGGSGALATEYEVFLSFRGPDTRHIITDCLYQTMVGRGIVAFRDSEEIHAGDRIVDLLTAVVDFKISIPILSKDYASRTWCLRELACVTELIESTRKREILPIFFNVTPSDVKLRTEQYVKDLEKHEWGHGGESTERWEAALRKVGEIKGSEVQRNPLCEIIDPVVREVLPKLKGKRRLLDSKLVEVDNRRVRRRITSWQKGGLLGSGSFGTVYEAITDDGFFFAVKEVSLLDQEGKQSYPEQEISLLSRFQHENIVQYHGTDKDDEKLYIFLERMTEGSLATHYKKYNLSDSLVSAYTRQILNGLEYLHDQNVIHRDIKCANVLVDVSGSVKLADFGLAKAIKLNDAKSCKGSAFWMAPEVVNLKDTGYGLAADIWSLGCTVLEMLTRQHPYPHLEGVQAAYRIGKGELPSVPDSLSGDARDFIFRCLQVNPNDRPSAVQLLEHPFVRKPPIATSSGFASPRFDNIWS